MKRKLEIRVTTYETAAWFDLIVCESILEEVRYKINKGSPKEHCIVAARRLATAIDADYYENDILVLKSIGFKNDE